MWILLTVIRWIGIVAGGLLLLALLILLSVLCVPVRYNVKACKGDTLFYDFKVHWLLSAISIRKKEDSDKIRFHIFGIPIKTLAGPESDEETSSDDKRQDEGRSSDKDSSSKGFSSKNRGRKRGTLSKNSKDKSTHDKCNHKKSSNKKKDKKHFSFEKISSIIRLVRDNKYVIRRLTRDVRDLICYIAPDKVQGQIIVGMEDPSSTGLLIGAMSLCPLVYQDGLRIVPDFDEARFTFDVRLMGKIRMLYFVRLALSLYRDDEVGHMIKQIKKSMR